jgi:chaperonin GroEL (HSP60 family)
VGANINVVVSGASVSDIILHFLDKYKIMVVRIMSKWELRRVARAIRATILSKYIIFYLDFKPQLHKKLDNLMM